MNARVSNVTTESNVTTCDRCAIRIACIFHLELERNAFVQALARSEF